MTTATKFQSAVNVGAFSAAASRRAAPPMSIRHGGAGLPCSCGVGCLPPVLLPNIAIIGCLFPSFPPDISATPGCTANLA